MFLCHVFCSEVFLHINSHGAGYYPQQGHTGEEYSAAPVRMFEYCKLVTPVYVHVTYSVISNEILQKFTN